MYEFLNGIAVKLRWFLDSIPCKNRMHWNETTSFMFAMVGALVITAWAVTTSLAGWTDPGVTTLVILCGTFTVGFWCARQVDRT